MTIINATPRASGAYTIESQSHRTDNWMGDGWLEVPENLVPTLYACGGYCDLQIENGVLTGVIPKERPAQPEPTYTDLQLTQQSITDLELTTIEQGQSMTDLELMIMEGYHV